ncbi:MAG: segregation and condensation protein A [Myxococcales bacterium]
MARPREREREEEAAEAVPDSVAFKIALPSFEGPLDLLLHLIREHELDILDIPIALIAEKYLEYLTLMQAMNLDVASEFLLMAATLAHLKSRMLLPREEAVGQLDEEEGEDPREALIKRLLEHQKYVEAGQQLGRRGVLGRDSFARTVAAEAAGEAGPEGLAEVSVFELVRAFDRVLKGARIEIREQLLVDRLSIGEAIARIGERLSGGARLAFSALFEPMLQLERHRVVVTFLALLEMVRLRLLRVFQEEGTGEILLEARGTAPAPGEVGDEYGS